MSYERKGWIEVIVGGMFSGKTEELIRRLRRSEFARQKIQVFKPGIDDRYDAKNVTSHNSNSFNALPIESSEEIWLHLNDDTQVVGIDEGQFFDHGLVEAASVHSPLLLQPTACRSGSCDRRSSFCSARTSGRESCC